MPSLAWFWADSMRRCEMGSHLDEALGLPTIVIDGEDPLPRRPVIRLIPGTGMVLLGEDDADAEETRVTLESEGVEGGGGAPYIPLPLTSFHDSGLSPLTSSTDAVLELAGDLVSVAWGPGNGEVIIQQAAVPPDLNLEVDYFIVLLVRTDDTESDPAEFTVSLNWGLGDGDQEYDVPDPSPSGSTHVVFVTVPIADLPVAALSLTVKITPSNETTDGIRLFSARIQPAT